MKLFSLFQLQHQHNPLNVASLFSTISVSDFPPQICLLHLGELFTERCCWWSFVLRLSVNKRSTRWIVNSQYWDTTEGFFSLRAVFGAKAWKLFMKILFDLIFALSMFFLEIETFFFRFKVFRSRRTRWISLLLHHHPTTLSCSRRFWQARRYWARWLNCEHFESIFPLQIRSSSIFSFLF